MSVQRRAGTSLFVDVRLYRGILTARLVGPSLALRESQIILNTIRAHLDAGDPVARVILDLTDVAYINSAGLSAVLRIQAAAAEQSAAVEIRHVQPGIRRVLELVGLKQVLARGLLGGDRRHRSVRRPRN